MSEVIITSGNSTINVNVTGVGPRGQSAYETWLALGNVGTKQDFINSQFDEPTRVSNENTRKQSELTRIENENARIEAENIRQQQENLRQQEFETNEVTRQTNETIRISNEEARQEADVLRGQTVEAIEQHYAPRLTTVEGQINTLDAQVADIPNQTYITDKATKTELQAVASGSPKGTYPTKADLDLAFPTGNTNIYVVTADGKWYYWNGTAWTVGGTYQSTGIADDSITPNKTNFVATWKNMYNKETRLDNHYISENNGAVVAYANYFTSDFIPIEAGNTYTINLCSKFVLFDTVKNYVSGLSRAQSAYTFTASANGFIRFSYQDSTGLLNPQMELGTIVTEYESYKLDIPSLFIKEEQISYKEIPVKKIKVVKAGLSVKIISMLNGKELKINTTVGGGNNLFNFVDTYYGTDKIHDCPDDIAPIRTFYTVGANHGYPSVRVTLAGHDKTSADVGSIWTDGTREYTLVKIDGNYLYFTYPYTVTSEIVGYVNTLPTATLTHVSGATHITNIAITTQSNQQLYPSINNHNLKYILDGKEITEDGTYYGTELQVQESYNIMCYKEIVDYIQSHVGDAISNNAIGGVVRLSINYVFGDKGTCTIHHNFRAIKKVTTRDSGFIQSTKLALSGYKLFEYIANVKAKAAANSVVYDFKTPIDVTSWNTSIYWNNTDYLDASIVPNRVVTWLQDATTNAKKIGFTMGYVIDKSNSKHTDRLSNAYRAMEIASTIKNYPTAINELKPYWNAGDYLNFICYRNYLSPIDNATNFNIVKDKKDVYVYIDYHVNVSFASVKLDDYIGKTITVIEKNTDFTLHNSIVDADGVVFSVTNNYGYAVLKLS